MTTEVVVKAVGQSLGAGSHASRAIYIVPQSLYECQYKYNLRELRVLYAVLAKQIVNPNTGNLCTLSVN